MLLVWLLAITLFCKETDGREVYGSPFIEGYRMVDTTALIQSVIVSKARSNNVDPDLLVKIARCESGLRPEAKNSLSTASGIFQFLTSTFISQAQARGFPTDDKNSVEVQAGLAAEMIADGGIGHWNASRTCWD